MDSLSNKVAFVASVIAIIFYINYSINDQINDPQYIRKIADEVHLPFVIFNEQKSIIFDNGAMKYINKIDVKKTTSFPSLKKIVISPKLFFSVPPILESIDDKEIGFKEAKRGEKFDLIYESFLAVSSVAVGDDPNSRRRFRLQLSVLPNE